MPERKEPRKENEFRKEMNPGKEKPKGNTGNKIPERK